MPTLPPGVLIHDPRNLDFVFRNEGIFTKGEFVKGRSWDLFGKPPCPFTYLTSQSHLNDIANDIA